MNTTHTEDSDAVAGQVERPVRPCGYLHGTDFIPHGPNGWTGGEPVYDYAALEAAVAAERERCARIVETQDTYGDPVGCWFETLAAKIRA